MKCDVAIKNNKITSTINLEDGIYELNIREKDKSRTYEQIKKLWATIDDISRADYGDTSQSQNIYFQILQMSGIQTEKIILPERALEPFRRKVRTLNVIGYEVVNHQPMVLVNACMKGISEMSKKELANVIETTIRYASEKGIEGKEI